MGDRKAAYLPGAHFEDGPHGDARRLHLPRKTAILETPQWEES